ncbi:hypothetical protein TraAM80_01567 [Trypanosoma rangeli]|uniref:DNA polymerase beta thumb domain-containing protein n=1 Tax=Trypanosoma rangeli TaxID=5698 RepID=A0A422NY56_TRYRA|nr:uncharacterized protein TraAM80_01567 [Trypanosoma rangeli]RNF10396.1 hypothetical protein TraAM80_01567 [Trypanosoma rangeli]|eukprot:RNF10396.1 hypothetical protein TraAM80_01567 [Trypanosoma rangeli]
MTVSHDDAVEHQLSVEQLLGPHGFRVTLVGKMRCGYPVGKWAMLLLTRDAQSSCDELLPSRGELVVNREVIFIGRTMKGLAASSHAKGVVRRNVWMCGGVCLCYVCFARAPQEYGPELAPRIRVEARELTFVWSSAHSFHVRHLFLTGPKQFLTHLMYLAHTSEYELTHDGPYQRSPNAGKRVELCSDEDIFTMLQLPYVDPLHRHA